MRLVILLLILFIPQAYAAETTQLFTDDLGRQVRVPVAPKRIVSLHDLDITLPLIELGVMPVASHGRTRADGSHFLRSGLLLTGVDFDNAPIKYIGTADIDIEAIASLKPDLIITEPSRGTPLEQLEKIAPTVSIDHLDGGAPKIYQKLATLTGTQAKLAQLERRYQAQIRALKESLGSQKISVSVIQANQGKMMVLHTYHSLGRVLRDAGFTFPALIENIPEGKRVDVSAEQLPELDATFVFATWRGDLGGKPQDELAAMEQVLPGWCQFLSACRAGRYILISREEAIANTYASLGMMAAQIQSQIAGRPLPESKP